MKKEYTYKDTLRACYFGFVTQAIIINLPPIFFVIFQNKFHISVAAISQLVIFNFLVQMLVDIISVKYIDKVGYRKSVIASDLFSAIGLILLGLLPNIMQNAYLGLMISVVIYAIGGGLTEVVISPIVDSISTDAKESTMNLIHSFFCWGQVATVALTTLFIKLFGENLWYIAPMLWALIPLGNMIAFTKVPLKPTLTQSQKTPIRELLSSRLFVIALILMICAGASEAAMNQWSSFFAEKGLHVTKVIGDLLGPCLMAVFMGIGRITFGFLGQKINMKYALTACSVFCLTCYLVTALSSNPVFSLMGCSFCGLAVSLMWPGTLTLASSKFPAGGAAMFSILAIFGDVGCSIGPFITGQISYAALKSKKILAFAAAKGLESEQIGLRLGMLCIAIFPIIMFVSLLAFKSRKKNQL